MKNSLALCQHFVLLHTATGGLQLTIFRFLNIWIKELKYSNIRMVQRSNIQIIQLDIQIFRYCTLTKFMLIPNLDKITTHFDFDNAFWARRTLMISENHFSIDGYICDIFSECMLKANVCFVLYGIFFGPL
jgi:hypothetical protein